MPPRKAHFRQSKSGKISFVRASHSRAARGGGGAIALFVIFAVSVLAMA